MGPGGPILLDQIEVGLVRFTARLYKDAIQIGSIDMGLGLMFKVKLSLYNLACPMAGERAMV